MGLLQRLVSRPQALDLRSAKDYADLFGQQFETDAGVSVSTEQALRINAVYACVRVIAEGIAQLPLHLYKRLDRGKERVPDHPAARLLNTKPNAWQTPYEFKETLAGNLALGGMGYGMKTEVRGETREILPVAASWVTVKLDLERDRFTYEVRRPGTSEALVVPAERMLVIRGFSLDGLVGLNPIAVQRETMGLAVQLHRQAARLFKNGAQLAGVLEHPNTLTDDALKRLKEQFEANYAGAGNAWKTLVIEEGMKYAKVGMTAEDAQFLESRKFERSEIAALFRVPPHMIGDLERATWNNIETQGREFVTYSLGSHLSRMEEAVGLSLLSETEQLTHYFEFLRAAFLRGDTLARYQAYQIAKSIGVLNPNEIRAMENMNPREGGDEYQDTPTGAAPNADPDPPPDDPPADTKKQRKDDEEDEDGA